MMTNAILESAARAATGEMKKDVVDNYDVARAVLRAALEAAERDPQAIESVVKADFLRHQVFQGYTQETKLNIWVSNAGIETRQFVRQLRALRTYILGEG